MAHIDASTGERSGNTFLFPRYAQGRGEGNLRRRRRSTAMQGSASCPGMGGIERGRCTALSGALHGRFTGHFATFEKAR